MRVSPPRHFLGMGPEPVHLIHERDSGFLPSLAARPSISLFTSSISPSLGRTSSCAPTNHVRFPRIFTPSFLLGPGLGIHPLLATLSLQRCATDALVNSSDCATNCSIRDATALEIEGESVMTAASTRMDLDDSDMLPDPITATRSKTITLA